MLLLNFTGAVVGYSLAIVARALESPGLLLLSRVPVGLCKQTLTVSRAVVADCTGADAGRSVWMARLGTALSLGYALGPFLGGHLAEHVHDAAPAFVAVATFVLLVPAVALLMPETAAGPRAPPCVPAPPPTDGARDPPLWRSRRFVALLLVLAVPELGLIAHTTTTLYTFCLRSLHKGAAWLGALTGATSVLQALLCAALFPALTARGWSDAAVLLLGTAAFAAASGAIALGQSPGSVALSVPATAVAIGALRTYPAALVSKGVPEHRQGEAMGALDLSSSAVRALAPLGAGALMDRLGGGATFTWQMVLFMAASVLLAVATRVSGRPLKTD